MTQQISAAPDSATARPSSNLDRTGRSRANARSERFWDRFAARYARKPVPDEAIYQRKLEITRGYFEPGTNVLEFGCGTGSTAIVHAPHVRHIRAIDISAKMIEIARGKAAVAEVNNVTFEQTTLEDLRAPACTFDAVLGLSILHLLDQWETAIDQVYALLKPGGVFVTSTPCLADTQNLFKLILPLGYRLGLLPQVTFFTRGALEARLADAGFKLDHVWQPGVGQAVFIVASKSSD